MGCLISIRKPLLVASLFLVTLVCCSTAEGDYTVQACGSNPNAFVFAGTGPSDIAVAAKCPAASYNGGGLSLFNKSKATAGQAGRLQATAPAGLELLAASANQIQSIGLNDGHGWGGGFYWYGGATETNDQTDQNPNVPMLFAAPSSYWGMQIICGKATCTQSGQLAAQSVTLDVRETTPPSFYTTGLSQASGWVRGSWPFVAWANSPSGVCSISTSLNGLAIASSSSPSHPSYGFHQCAAPEISQTVDTSRYGNGAVALALGAGDAAGVPAALNTTVHIDNTQPTVSLSGPIDAASTAGTQYITATATAGPSGVDGISCSADGAPSQWYSGSSAQVPVYGVGEHTVNCSAANNAVDPAGNRGWSNPYAWALKIAQPTLSAISFGRVINALRCQRVTQRVRVRARWVTVTRHHHRVKVKRAAHTKTIKVTRCHPRTKTERVTVRARVRRDGRVIWIKRKQRKRVVLVPHVKHSASLRVAHGKKSRVSGWLGTSSGVALAGQTVAILTAPDNGLNRFTITATTTTTANGTWTTTLPAGPSRLIQAAYNGSPTTQASTSSQIQLTVPAKIRLISVTPRRIPWGGAVRLTGRLQGGYLPRGGALVRLRIGEGAAQTTYGVRTHVGGNGRFTTTYTFGQGVASVHRSYWFQLASLPTGNYPYAPAASRRLSVDVGGRPRTRP